MIPPPRRARRAHVLASALASALVAASPATAEDPDALRAALERDRAVLIDLLRTPRSDDAPPLADDPTLRAIARRMPRIQAALRAPHDNPDAPR